MFESHTNFYKQFHINKKANNSTAAWNQATYGYEINHFFLKQEPQIKFVELSNFHVHSYQRLEIIPLIAITITYIQLQATFN